MLQFDPVTEQLFVGTCPKDAADICLLKENEVGHVVCLQSNADFIALGINWDALEAGYREAGVRVNRIAMIDFDESNIATRLANAALVIDEAISGSSKVYLHCTAGRERAPTVAAAWLMLNQKLSAAEAIKIVKDARPSNPYLFMLEHYEQSLCNR